VSNAPLLIRRYGIDALIAFAAVEAALEVVLRPESEQTPESRPWLAVPAVVLIVVPLFVRRGLPVAASLAVWLLGAAFSFIDGRLVPYTGGVSAAGMAASFMLGRLPDEVRARAGLAVVLGSAAIVVYNAPHHEPGDFIFIPGLFGASWLAGFALRQRSERAEAAEERVRHAEREREATTRLAIAEERARIARELHDVVAHAVSVMVLQVGAVRHNLSSELEEDREALARVERAGRDALSEMRRLLGAMRRDEDGAELAPQPGLDRLSPLLADIERAGLPVRLHVDGDPFPLSATVDLSAYRIVQEGLTNALRHASATCADVTLRYASDGLGIEVRDDGIGDTSGAGSGQGLVGVRERVKICGGEMYAGADPRGGFVLRAQLPLGGNGR